MATAKPKTSNYKTSNSKSSNSKSSHSKTSKPDTRKPDTRRSDNKRPAASRANDSRSNDSKPTYSRPADSRTTSSRPAASKPTASRTYSRSSASRPAASKLTSSRPNTSSPNTSRPSYARSADSKPTPSKPAAPKTYGAKKTTYNTPKNAPQNATPNTSKNTQRLSKTLAYAGVASRRAAEELIFQGTVTVNGQVVLVPQTMVDVERDVIVYDGRRIRLEEKVYYVLHKPTGYICSNAPGKKRAIDLIGPNENRLYTIGRLDRDTSGLIILTNDGEFANSIMHPSKRIPKEYLVKVDKEVLHEHLVSMSEGMWVEGAFVKPMSVNKVRRGTLKVVICDGRKREVRRLVEKAGLETVELIRIRIGGLVLGKMPVGHFRELSLRERELLLQTQKTPSKQSATTKEKAKPSTPETDENDYLEDN